VEPHAEGIAALHSPTTAIVDYGEIARSLAAEITSAGGTLRLGAEVTRVRDDGGRPEVHLADGAVLSADRVLVCAGLYADRLARLSGQDAAPRIIPFRGEYWAIRPGREHLVRGLIYPVPEPGLPFLGVHLTRMIDGSVLVGPNAVLALAREGYGWRTVSVADIADIAGWPGMWRLAAVHRRTAVHEVTRSLSRRLFARDARRFVPELDAADLIPARAGVRAQAVGRDGALVDDFDLADARNVVWVRNAPSPAATSSLAIAEELVDRLRISSAQRRPSIA
jgi:L-2-hydroxyglutarate oxidase